MSMKEYTFYDIRVGDQVRWMMREENCDNRGTVIDADLQPNMTGTYVPWYLVQDLDGKVHAICGISTNIRLINLEIISRKKINV